MPLIQSGLINIVIIHFSKFDFKLNTEYNNNNNKNTVVDHQRNKKKMSGIF